MADGNEFIVGLLKSIQGNIAETAPRMDRVDARLTGIEYRMARMEKRQTAAMHFKQSVLVELTGMNERLDNISAEMLGFDRRLSVLEVRG